MENKELSPEQQLIQDIKNPEKSEENIRKILIAFFSIATVDLSWNKMTKKTEKEVVKLISDKLTAKKNP